MIDSSQEYQASQTMDQTSIKNTSHKKVDLTLIGALHRQLRDIPPPSKMAAELERLSSGNLQQAKSKFNVSHSTRGLAAVVRSRSLPNVSSAKNHKDVALPGKRVGDSPALQRWNAERDTHQAWHAIGQIAPSRGLADGKIGSGTQPAGGSMKVERGSRV
jgi:hypothetical protein